MCILFEIMAEETRTRAILFWILLNFIRVPLHVAAKDASFCFKKETHYNVILKGELKAGKYTPWEPSDVSHMTIDKCTEHCCKSPDTDVVFLLNRLFESYCFCVKCYSDQLCSLVKITPPASFTPITITVMKGISTTTATPVSSTRIVTRTKSSISSTQSTTVKPEQKEGKRTTRRTEDVTTKSAETTSDRGLRRRTGEETELGGQRSSSPNLEVRNANLPALNGYSQTKEGVKSEAVTSYNGINSETIPTTSNIGINITTPANITTTGPTTPRPTRLVKTERKVEGKGNDDISLQCPGALKVIRVAAFGIPGDNKTIVDFDKHCQANLAQVDGTNVCIVSLKRVYKSSYPPFIKTIVTYSCTYTESDVS